MVDNNLTDPIVAALQSGDLRTAESRCRAALELLPDDATLLQLLGLGLQWQGRPSDALDVFARLVEMHPGHGAHWSNYAAALHAAGDRGAAEQAMETAVRHAPDDPDRLGELGLIQLENGRPVQAHASLMRAFELAPEAPVVRIHAARACLACGDDRADALLRPWRQWLPLEDDLVGDLAGLLLQIGQFDDGIELLEGLVSRVPTHWSMQLALAKSYERVNRLEQARARLQSILVAAPLDSDPGIRREVERQHAQLAMRDKLYASALELLQRAGPTRDTDEGHYFALARAHDRLDETDAAMLALATAHAIQMQHLRSSSPYLLNSDTPLLPRVNDRVTGDDYRAWPMLKAPDAGQSPIFVVGFPRSGTTLLEQMLDAHPDLQSMDEQPLFSKLAHRLESAGAVLPQDLCRLSQRDCDELRRGYAILAGEKVSRRPDTRLVDKNPLNMSWLPIIHRIFPQAKFVFALRHPCDVILSCYLQQFRSPPMAAACRSLETLARAYVAAMENWLHHASLFRTDVFVSRHEDLVADAPAQVGRIAAFLDLDEPGSMLGFADHARRKGYIGTPSYAQVIEPISAKGVGRWLQYASHFDPVLPILQSMLSHWGYDGGQPVEIVRR